MKAGGKQKEEVKQTLRLALESLSRTLLGTSFRLVSWFAYSSALKMGAKYSYET
jgi:hypothetical protein